MSVTRIYADYNGLVSGIKNPDRDAVVLDTFGSLRDLSNAALVLSEGLPLIGVDASDELEDLEGHGTAQYDPDRKWWVIEFDELGVRYVPACDRSPVNEFLCVKCRNPFPDGEANTFDVSCSSCGTSVLAAFAPPKHA